MLNDCDDDHDRHEVMNEMMMMVVVRDDDDGDDDDVLICNFAVADKIAVAQPISPSDPMFIYFYFRTCGVVVYLFTSSRINKSQMASDDYHIVTHFQNETDQIYIYWD